MAATNEADRLRIDVENAIARLMKADDHLRVGLMLLSQFARTDREIDVMREMLGARKAVSLAHDRVVGLHRNRRER